MNTGAGKGGVTPLCEGRPRPAMSVDCLAHSPALPEAVGWRFLGHRRGGILSFLLSRLWPFLVLGTTLPGSLHKPILLRQLEAKPISSFSCFKQQPSSTCMSSSEWPIGSGARVTHLGAIHHDAAVPHTMHGSLSNP